MKLCDPRTSEVAVVDFRQKPNFARKLPQSPCCCGFARMDLRVPNNGGNEGVGCPNAPRAEAKNLRAQDAAQRGTRTRGVACEPWRSAADGDPLLLVNPQKMRDSAGAPRRTGLRRQNGHISNRTDFGCGNFLFLRMVSRFALSIARLGMRFLREERCVFGFVGAAAESDLDGHCRGYYGVAASAKISQVFD